VLPTFDEKAITDAAPGLVQYQLVPGQGGDVTVRYMAGSLLSKVQEAALSRALNSGIGHEFAYRFERVERIAQTCGRKHRRWVG